MVTGDEEIKYGYLLDPCFQMVNTAGKPLTSGWIEVYIAGTRNKYYCSSDFAGTLHPFKIPLDSLGSNIILADVEKSYDVYVYNKFGNLTMSRYNITPGKGGAGGSVSGSGIAEHWIGKNGQNSSIPAGTDTALKLPLSYEYEGSFIDRINENRTAFYLKEGLYLVQAVVNFKQSDQSLTNEISQVDVFTRSDDTPEDMSFNRDMAGPDSSDDSHCLKVSFIRCVKEDDEVSQIVLFKVNTPNAWSECYLQNVQIARLSSGGAGAGGQTYYAGDYISIDEETNTISVTGIDPDSYATHDELQSATSAFITSADLSGYATEQWVLDKHYITSADIPDETVVSGTSGIYAQKIGDDWIVGTSAKFATSGDIDPDKKYALTTSGWTEVQRSLELADSAIQGVKLHGAKAQIIPDSSNIVTIPIFSTDFPGLVPSATLADADKVLKGDGTWGDAGSSVRISYDPQTEELHMNFSPSSQQSGNNQSEGSENT